MDFDSDAFRSVMGHFATGVSVVTTLEDDRPWGITVNALSSVSLEPPIVMVALDHRRRIAPVVRAAGRYAVNILGETQQDLSDCFAGAPVDPDRGAFCGASWRPGGNGMPILDGAIASLECEIVDIHAVGDHRLFIGRVTAIESDDDHPMPLLFYRRRYLRIERAAPEEIADLPRT
jgi:3-hydroxy-9,10-secoandrosta-1,3,5(10)-triene-9,17-dione monooxygenase reductase component